MAYQILVVDDEPALRMMVQEILTQAGYAVCLAGSCREALTQRAQVHPDAILLDVMLPDGDGFSLLGQLRQQGDVPVLFLSARDEDEARLRGLGLGADDYITKPFRPLVLGAKVKALIRRSRNLSSDSPDQLECGPFSYNTSTMRFYKDGGEIFLSSKESSLMLLFMKHPGQVFTKEMIYEHVWGNTIAVDDNAIMVYINRLRSKIEEDRQKPAHIMTVRGLGYRFVP